MQQSRSGIRPSAKQLRALRVLAAGHELALFRGGAYRCLQTGEVVSAAVLRACLRNAWTTGMPGLPLLEPGRCRITALGLAALEAAR